MEKEVTSLGIHIRAGHFLALLTASSVFASGHIIESHADDPEVPQEPSINLVDSAPEMGASTDTDQIQSAGKKFDPADLSSVAGLADAASGTDAVPMAEQGTALASLGPHGEGLVVKPDGAAAVFHPEYPSISLRTVGEPENVVATDGAMILDGVAPDTDVVVRAVEGGAQMIAVLASPNAPKQIEFEVDMPSDARLRAEPDGSFTILAPVVKETYDQAALDAFDAKVEEILAGSEDNNLTDDQRRELDKLHHPAPAITVELGETGSISPAWAVDAQGKKLRTHYELNGTKLVQVVETTSDTTYPVTADPGFWWYVRKAVECVAGISLLATAGAKVATAAVKIFRMLKSARAGSALRRAYNAWLRLGTNNDQRIGNLMFNLRVIADLYRQHGAAKASAIIADRGGRVKATRDLITGGASVIATVLGVGSCISLVTGRDY